VSIFFRVWTRWLSGPATPAMMSAAWRLRIWLRSRPRHSRAEVLCGQLAGRGHSDRADVITSDAACGDKKGIEQAAEARVVQRLTAKLRSGPLHVGAAKGFLGNPLEGGGPEDVRIVKDWEAFVERHLGTFQYDPPAKRISLLAPVGKPSSEVRVVQRPKKTRRSGQHGNTRDLKYDTVAEAGARSKLNTSALGEDAVKKTPELSGSSGDTEVEVRVVERLTMKLRCGPIHCDALKGYLGDPRKGGGPVEKQVVKNWKAFVSRHEDTFSYDDVSKVVSLCASVADTATETRVVNRLKTRLQGGPVHINHLRSFLGDPQQGGGPEDLRPVVDWETFVVRHAGTFIYDAVTKNVSACAPIVQATIGAEVVVGSKAEAKGEITQESAGTPNSRDLGGPPEGR